MQYINDDMDELFRRAAEDYSLNTNSADWNAVVKKLSAKSTGITNNDKQRSKKYKRLLLLLLLLPIAWLGKDYFYQHDGQQASDSPGSMSPVKKDVSKNKLLSPEPGASTLNKHSSSSAVARVTLRDDSGTSTFLQLTDQNNNPYHQKGTVHIDVFTPMISNADAPDKTNSTIVIDTDNKQTVLNKEEGITELKNGEVKSSTQQEANKENNTTVSKNKNRKQKTNGIYAGVMISPDISTIKFQAVKNIGLSEGIIIGYQINKSIAIETGLAWNKKYYNSDGKYFNAKNITLPTYAQVKKLEGTCKMIEVPVTVRYNFKTSAKANLSVAGGMSSYFMKKENYNYTIERNGAQYPRNAHYNNSSTDLFAVANVAFAYNRNLGKKTVLRLEPYVKIPVRGVGIGDLPIMSTGINVAVTKKLFK